MGRPFADEVAELEETHHRACAAPIETLVQSLQPLLGHPLLAVGSGGSLTTATLASVLYRDVAYGLGMAVTPLELANRRAMLRSCGVMIATAGGSNSDAIGALRIAAQSEARQIVALCTKVGSKLSSEAARFSNVTVSEFEHLAGQDGFLATNSLWASAVALYRGFALVAGATDQPPKELSQIVDASRWPTFVKSVCANASPLWERDTVIVLHGAASLPAAIDLESKLTEAALSNVWIADYRHFAHGRHHWLAKRAKSTSVIAFIAESEADLATRTLDQIPPQVPQMRIPLTDHPCAILSSLAHVFPIVLSAGSARGIDPGRPGVPAFGRRIYNLNAYGKLATNKLAKPDPEALAIERKTATALASLRTQRLAETWRDAFQGFVGRLQTVHYGAVVFDYDGTLCSSAERFVGLRGDVAIELNRLVEAGVRVGIATGRGKSVRESLRGAIKKDYWSSVAVGYYNGGQIGWLDQDDIPDGTPRIGESLVDVLSALKSHVRLNDLATIEGRLTQITLEAKSPAYVEECWNLAVHIANLTAPGKVKLVRSSHSLDLLPVSVSKLDVIRKLQLEDTQILAIGDKGMWPGNDFELLSHPYSLSVDEVSPSLTTCWNLAPAGVRGVDALLVYLRLIHVNKRGRLRIRLTSGRPEKR